MIITTRAIALGRLARRLVVETFSQEQGVLLLLRRSGLIALDADISQALPQDHELAKLITQEVGGLPLALVTGVGSELRRPLGITIVGGLIFSQAVTLYTTPVIYLYMDRLRLRIERLRGRR